jgi:signal peptide peptidase SppA
MNDFGYLAINEHAYNEIRRETGIMADRSNARWFGGNITADGIGIITIEGTLGHGWWGIPYKVLARQIEKLDEDPTTKAILLDINSPGGAINGLVELAQSIKKCSKPIYAYTEGYCTSAAYLLASTATQVFASPQATIGSIGVLVHIVDDSRQMEKIGISETVMRSRHAAKKALDPHTDEGRKEIQSSLDTLEELFIREIANNRGVSSEDVIERFGQGLTFHAVEAMEKGMIDTIVSDFDACVDKIKPSLAGGGGVVMGQATETTVLTIETLRAQHPELASILVEEGRALGFTAGRHEGVTAERTRIVMLSALRQVEFGTEVIEQAIQQGESIEQAKSMILDKQMESAKKGPAKPAVVSSLANIAAESASSEINPVEPVIQTGEMQVENAANRAIAAIHAQKKGMNKE